VTKQSRDGSERLSEAESLAARRPEGKVPTRPLAAGNERALIAAYEAALVVASEMDIAAVLQRIVDLAREVVPARYAALGVADDEGRIVQFVTSGITPEERAALGPLPQGHGLLGVLIRERTPLLIPDIAQDPRSVGFPRTIRRCGRCSAPRSSLATACWATST
jgi:hypothetical protein